MRAGRTRFAVALLSVGIAGCSLVVDDQVGRLEFSPIARRDVTLSLREFQPHESQTIDFMMVNQDELILSRAVIDALPSPCMNLTMRRAIPLRVRRVDFYADVNENGRLDAPPKDHSWREDLGLDARMVFTHSFDFVDLTPCPEGDPTCTRRAPRPGLADFVLSIRNPGDFVGQVGAPLQVIVIHLGPEGSESEVGYYRLDRVPDNGETIVTLPSVIDGGSPYSIEVSGGPAGATRVCTIPTRAPTTGPLSVELDLQPNAEAPCEERAPRTRFEDCAP